jgi:hypothetical protein
MSRHLTLMPTHIIQYQRLWTDSVGMNCIVCLDSTTEQVITNCGHVLCRSCHSNIFDVCPGCHAPHVSPFPPVPHPSFAWDYQSIHAIASHCDQICSICTDEFVVNDMLAVLQCGHSYHQTCIKGWLPIKASCPFCRAEVKSCDAN